MGRSRLFGGIDSGCATAVRLEMPTTSVEQYAGTLASLARPFRRAGEAGVSNFGVNPCMGFMSQAVVRLQRFADLLR